MPYVNFWLIFDVRASEKFPYVKIWRIFDVRTLTFDREFQIIYTGSGFNVIGEIIFDVEDYEMPDGMLSDFTENAAVRLADDDYQKAAINNPGNCWGTNYLSTQFLSSCGYIDEGEAPEGSTNGGYRFAWADSEGLLYPSLMLAFPQEVEFNTEDELVFRFYLSETFDTKAVFWITTSLEPNVWDAQVKISCKTFTAGAWNEIAVSAAEFVDNEGKIAPIAFTFCYADAYSGTTVIPGAEVIFDTATFRQIEKVVDEEYETLDVSEIVPIGDGKSFTGTRETYVEEFNYDVPENVAFARTDKSVEGVKAKLTINDLSQFSFFFVLNGTNLYYHQGGIFYWFSHNGIQVGYNNKVIVNEPLPASITAGTPFDVEMRAIPYYVDGLKAGYYAQVLVNGTEIGKGDYVSNQNCFFNNWFGMYLHVSTAATTVTVAPQTKCTDEVIGLTLSTSLNATQVGIDESLGTKVKVSGKIYGASDVKYEVVSGADCATVDADGYINGVKNGVAVIRASVENVFGTFYSNEVTVTVGTGGEATEEPEKDKGGCKGFMGYQSAIIFGAAIVALSAITLKKKN